MDDFKRFSEEIRGKLEELSGILTNNDRIEQELYTKYQVKRGLRDENGKGVVAGLTEISEIVSSTPDNQPCTGELYYRGRKIEDLVDGFTNDNRFGFEETAYLLLFGEMPSQKKLDEFNYILCGFRSLPISFVRDIIMKAPSNDMMNVLARSVLTLYSYDEKADDISIANILRQSLQLIAQFPLISVYGYQVYKHYKNDGSLIIHKPMKNLSTAENILYMLRDDSSYSDLEAKLLDLCLVLHAEHGGGNNSTFTTHVVSSSGTDTYATITASLGSLKGPKHGGANIKVVQMFADMKATLKSRSDEDITDYLTKLLSKEGFDNSGLIYGMGHAVYSLSDPRADIMRDFCRKLALEKGLTEELELYEKVEKLAPIIIGEKRKIYKGVSANVDFYSGLVYSMLNLPIELYTPIFAIARIVGWSAHRMEEISNNGKIIRPGYKSVAERKEYVKMADR